MAWTYAALKSAIASLSLMPVGNAAIAAAINAENDSPTTVDIQSSAVEAIVVPTGEFYAIYQASLKAPSGASPPTAADQVIAGAWNFYRMLNQWTTVSTSQAPVLAGVKAALGGLEAAGLISTNSVAAIEALWVSTPPLWVPAVTVGDVQTALGTL